MVIVTVCISDQCHTRAIQIYLGGGILCDHGVGFCFLNKFVFCAYF